MRTFGDQERVLVDGEPGTVVDSPQRHVYRVELDSGATVERMGATLRPLRDAKPEVRLTYVTIERHPNDRWSIILREGVLGPSLFEARQLASLDDALEQLTNWRKGVIII